MKIKVLITLCSLLAISLFELKTAHSSSAGKAVKTGAPGEGTCRDCHNSNALNAAGGSVSISSPDLSTNEYIGGQTYQINVTVERNGLGEFGFGFEALKPDGTNAGTLTSVNTNETHILTGTVSGNVRNTMTHKTNSGINPNTKTFTFNWVAPPVATGPVTFYATGNAVNQSGNTSGDFVYSTTLALQEFNPSSIEILNNINSQLSTFPNPVNEDLTVTFHSPENGLYVLQLIQMNSGMIAYGENFMAAKGNNRLTLENKGWAAGIYLLKLSYRGKEISKKIIVQ